MAIDWQPLIDIIHDAQRFVITSHVRPDADAIGSEIGLAILLESLGKEVRIINPSETPDHLAFLDPDKRVKKIKTDVTVESSVEADVHIVVDTSAWVQVEAVRQTLEVTQARKVVIDHHVSSDDLGAIEFKDTGCSATGVLILELCEAMGHSPTGMQAVALFAAIATDTGWFRHSNTDARTLQAAARLVECGVEPHRLFRELYERSSLSRLKLHSIALARASLEFDGRIAYTFVFRKDFDETGAHPSDTEELVNRVLTIDGVEAAFILVQQLDQRVKVSFRSRTDLDVAAVAEQFGGGGHKKASGAMLSGPMENARSSVLKALETALTPPQA